MHLKATLAALFISLSTAACGNVAILRDPMVLAVSNPGSETGDIIADAFEARRWLITDREPGRIEAELSTRGHRVVVEAVYDEEEIQINYLESTNMHYREGRDGRMVIHRKYHQWVDRVLKLAHREMRRYRP